MSNRNTKTFCAVLPREANTFPRDSVSVAKETKWKGKRATEKETGLCIQKKEAGGWDRCCAMHSTQWMPEDASIAKVPIFIVKGRIKRGTHQRSL